MKTRYLPRLMVALRIAPLFWAASGGDAQGQASVPDAVTLVLSRPSWVDDGAEEPDPFSGQWFKIDVEQRSEGPTSCTISETNRLRYVYRDGLSYPELSSDGKDWSGSFSFAVSGLELEPRRFECARAASDVVSEAFPDGLIEKRGRRVVYRLGEHELHVVSRMAMNRIEVVAGDGTREQIIAREPDPSSPNAWREVIADFRVRFAGDLNNDGALDLLISLEGGREFGRDLLLLSSPDEIGAPMRRVAEAMW